MKRVRWGILSTADIGVEKVIPGLQASPSSEVVAIASRDRDRAQAAADRLGLPEAYGSYEALLGDDGLDAVYIPLPNHLHVEWTRKALDAGKHVLCEKPIALDAAGAEALQSAAADAHPDLKVMEAFMYRFHPQWQRARDLIAEGQIGDLRAVDACFSYFNDDPDDIRNQTGTGGGGLLDIGCYCVSVARWLFGAEPTAVQGTLQNDPRFGVDRLASGVLTFPEGTATFTCATQLRRHQHVRILGTEGRLEVETPFTPAPDDVPRLRLERDGETEEFTADATDHYATQGEAFARAVLDDTPVPTPLSDAVANMRVLDAVRASANE